MDLLFILVRDSQPLSCHKYLCHSCVYRPSKHRRGHAYRWRSHEANKAGPVICASRTYQRHYHHVYHLYTSVRRTCACLPGRVDKCKYMGLRKYVYTCRSNDLRGGLLDNSAARSNTLIKRPLRSGISRHTRSVPSRASRWSDSVSARNSRSNWFWFFHP